MTLDQLNNPTRKVLWEKPVSAGKEEEVLGEKPIKTGTPGVGLQRFLR